MLPQDKQLVLFGSVKITDKRKGIDYLIEACKILAEKHPDYVDKLDDKNEVILLSDKYYVFRLNLLNIVSTRTQRLEERQWKKTPLTVKERVLSFFQNHTTSAKGEKIFEIKMTTLANEIDDRRVDVC